MIATWFRNPKDRLDGMSPVEWIQRGHDPQGVVSLARGTARQQGPSSDVDYADFPTFTVAEGSVWFRCHRRRPAANNGAWWFQPASEPYDSDDPGGRFDLHSPSGTCYVADSALTALWEFVGAVYLDNGLRVSETFLEGHLISALSIPHSEVAALLAGHTGMRGVTRELSTTADYDMCQSWAEAFHDVGLDGLRYEPRFSPGDSVALALFGPAGALDPTRDGDPSPITALSVALASGLSIDAVPPSGEMDSV